MKNLLGAMSADLGRDALALAMEVLRQQGRARNRKVIDIYILI
jgi:hypothetical protein